MSTETTTEEQRAAKAIDSLRHWANENQVATELLLEALKDSEGLTNQHDKSYPPFHTSVVWGDIRTASGSRLHVVARAGATSDSIVANIGAIANAFDVLCEDHGYMLADRMPQQAPEAEKAAVRATRTEATGEHDAPEEATPEDRFKVIQVEEIMKGVTQTGKTRYTVKGFPWPLYGVTCWPDSGRISKLTGVVDLDKWEVGQTIGFGEVDIKAVVKLKEGEKPDKVVDWQGADALSEEVE